jgi:hypothetical protein
MEIPNNIKSVIQRICESEDYWKSKYMAVWGFANEIKKNRSSEWDNIVKLGLPASSKKYQEYKWSELHNILTNQDRIITFEHLQMLFSLFETLLNDVSPILCNRKEYDVSNWEKNNKGMKNFFEDTKLIENSELKELRLAKVTRNCYIHNDSKVDEYWEKTYFEARKKEPILKNEFVDSAFDEFLKQVEDWHKLILNITKKIENKLSDEQFLHFDKQSVKPFTTVISCGTCEAVVLDNQIDKIVNSEKANNKYKSIFNPFRKQKKD